MDGDFKLIVHKLPKEYPYINIYPISDVHIGAAECSLKMFESYLDYIAADPYGFVVLLGDMLNNGIKSSKSNVYNEVMRPREQKEYLYQKLLPLKHKILGIVDGNHCRRSVKEVDNSPLYEVACRLGIENVYREYIAFLKVSLGTQKKNGKQVCYTIALHHGGTEGKVKNFQMSIDNLDIWLSGHIHFMNYKSPSKIIIDTKNEKVQVKRFRSLIVDSFLNYGEYTVEKLYLPQTKTSMQILELRGNQKNIILHDMDYFNK